MPNEPTRPPNPHDMAVDGDGQPLPFTPTEVRAFVLRAIEEGTIRAVVLELPSGDLAVQMFDDGPKQTMLAVLEQATEAYRTIVKGHA